jgi:hypothetical protein
LRHGRFLLQRQAVLVECPQAPDILE